jgi:FKBP-type peptidyl-prolyl cis-trans isomerase
VTALLKRCKGFLRSAYRRAKPTAKPTGEIGIEDVRVGTGPMPETGKVVVTHYTGWLEDGAEFDSSKGKGRPFEFVLGQGEVIPGWEAGVKTMKVGGCRLITVPPHLAYGRSGTPGGPIPPNATLKFEIELLAIKSPDQSSF